MKDASTSELRKYLASADQTNSEALNEYSSLIQGIELCDRFFSERLLEENLKMGATQGILAMHARMLLFSATRMALSGHATATLPLLRTSLEAACYSYLVGRDADKETIWLNRHESEEAGSACRKAFRSAVSDAAKLIEAQDDVSAGTQQLINDAYQASIDFGAHPNPKSVLPHLRIDKERKDGKIEVGLVALHSLGAFEYNRSLYACVEYGFIAALVIACGLRERSEEVMIDLHELNDAKENLVSEYFAESMD